MRPGNGLIPVETVLRLKNRPVEVRNPEPADLGELQISKCSSYVGVYGTPEEVWVIPLQVGRVLEPEFLGR